MFLKKNVFNGPNTIGEKKESIGCGNMEVISLPCQSSFGRVARKEIRLLLLKGEKGVRTLKQSGFFFFFLEPVTMINRRRVGDVQKGKQSFS